MSIEISLLTGPLYIEPPYGLTGWLGWLFLLGLVVLFLWRWRDQHKPWTASRKAILVFLVVLIPVTSLFIALRLPAGAALPPPGKPVDPAGPALIVFAALPWMVAAGLLGTWPAMLLAALSGTLVALVDTHSPFTPLEFALLGLVLSLAFQQRYRTTFYRLARHPLVAAVMAAALYPALFVLATLFITGGELANRLDYAVTRAGYATLAVAGELLLAGMFAEVLAVALPGEWGQPGPRIPSPSELKLENRLLYSMAPIAVLLLGGLIVGDWIVAGNAAREMLRDRMGSTAQVAADTVPFFLEAGQNLIQQMATDERLSSAGTPEEIHAVLAQELPSVPFFRQLFFIDTDGNPVTGYPLQNYANSDPQLIEMEGVRLALNGIPIQNYTIPPVQGESAAQVTFVAAVTNRDGAVQGVLIGRSDLASNPYTQPVLAGIRSVAGADGEGMLLDSEGRILYHPDSIRLMKEYTGRVSDRADFFDDTAADGTRQLVYYQPVQGHPWSVVLSVPARRAQQMALNIAAPLLAMVLLLFGSTVALLRVGLSMVTASLQNLSIEANRIASGQLDHRLQVDGEDEVGQLRRAFEQMRLSLKARLDELNRLLVASQGVASSLEISEAARPVMEAALGLGAAAVRIVLAPVAGAELLDEAGHPARLGIGPASDTYSYLDEQVLGLNRQQERVVLTNLSRLRTLSLPIGLPRPESLLALALRHENTYYGSLWLAYDRPHQFSEDEVRFLTTLAGQAALAAANVQLFQTAEIGRQRLESILHSTPDPVLVTDRQNNLLLANPAAWHALGPGVEKGEGQPIERVTRQPDLVNLLRNPASENESREIAMADNRIYLATASLVMADGKPVGRICVLRDITHFKEIDQLKSEFVSTVSHDLRSPLTLMRGYATMLEMVGSLNEQQTGYVRKIITAVESMSRLVNNLLDLSRIDAGVDLHVETVSIPDVVERVTGALQILASQKQIEMQVEISDQTVPLIEADQALLQQALHNLVENAIKYTDSGGLVRVCVTAHPEGMVFSVSDTGIGVAPVDLPRLFEKFYRGASKETSKRPGTGLGLAIVKSISERHGGKVWADSTLGKGSTFNMLIPVRQPRKGLKRKNE